MLRAAGGGGGGGTAFTRGGAGAGVETEAAPAAFTAGAALPDPEDFEDFFVVTFLLDADLNLSELVCSALLFDVGTLGEPVVTREVSVVVPGPEALVGCVTLLFFLQRERPS